MSQTDEGLVIGGLLVIVFIVGMIYTSISSSIDTKKNKELVDKTLFPNLSKLDNEVKRIVEELSKWVIGCEKCNNHSFRIKSLEETKLIYSCNRCNKNTTLKYDNTFYHINSIPQLHKVFNEIISYMNRYKLPAKYVNSKRDGYEENKSFEVLMNNLHYEYFTFNYYKKHTTWAPNVGNITFNGEGSEMERIVEQLEKKKIEKLSPNRKDLDKKVIKEWNYKKITSSSKGEIIKNWAKKSGMRCIDGSKCGGVLFKELPNNEITFGHIIPQSWGVEYPHMVKTIHHPDNLYLSCKSCNSSLNSNFPSTELKNKISKREGTIGDWLRTHIQEFDEE